MKTYVFYIEAWGGRERIERTEEQLSITQDTVEEEKEKILQKEFDSFMEDIGSGRHEK